MSGIRIDARGLRCPWPVLRLARAMVDHEAATIVADDPAAPAEIAALAEARGWRLSVRGETFDVRRQAGRTSSPASASAE